MAFLKLPITIVHIIVAVVLIVVVLLQESHQRGITGVIGGGAETFFGKNKGRTIDGLLKKLTAVFAIVFVATSIFLSPIFMDSNEAIIDENMVDTQDIEMNMDDLDANAIEMNVEGTESGEFEINMDGMNDENAPATDVENAPNADVGDASNADEEQADDTVEVSE